MRLYVEPIETDIYSDVLDHLMIFNVQRNIKNGIRETSHETSLKSQKILNDCERLFRLKPYIFARPNPISAIIKLLNLFKQDLKNSI